MIEVEFDIQVAGIGKDDPLLEDYELNMMLDHTKAQINNHVQRSLSEMRCAEHDQPAKVLIAGEYSLETEQLDVSYHVDTCCKAFLMQTVIALNRG